MVEGVQQGPVLVGTFYSGEPPPLERVKSVLPPLGYPIHVDPRLSRSGHPSRSYSRSPREVEAAREARAQEAVERKKVQVKA